MSSSCIPRGHWLYHTVVSHMEGKSNLPPHPVTNERWTQDAFNKYTKYASIWIRPAHQSLSCQIQWLPASILRGCSRMAGCLQLVLLMQPIQARFVQFISCTEDKRTIYLSSPLDINLFPREGATMFFFGFSKAFLNIVSVNLFVAFPPANMFWHSVHVRDPPSCLLSPKTFSY